MTPSMILTAVSCLGAGIVALILALKRKKETPIPSHDNPYYQMEISRRYDISPMADPYWRGYEVGRRSATSESTTYIPSDTNFSDREKMIIAKVEKLFEMMEETRRAIWNLIEKIRVKVFNEPTYSNQVPTDIPHYYNTYPNGMTSYDMPVYNTFTPSEFNMPALTGDEMERRANIMCAQYNQTYGQYNPYNVPRLTPYDIEQKQRLAQIANNEYSRREKLYEQGLLQRTDMYDYQRNQAPPNRSNYYPDYDSLSGYKDPKYEQKQTIIDVYPDDGIDYFAYRNIPPVRYTPTRESLPYNF